MAPRVTCPSFLRKRLPLKPPLVCYLLSRRSIQTSTFSSFGSFSSVASIKLYESLRSAEPRALARSLSEASFHPSPCQALLCCSTRETAAPRTRYRRICASTSLGKSIYLNLSSPDAIGEACDAAPRRQNQGCSPNVRRVRSRLAKWPA